MLHEQELELCKLICKNNNNYIYDILILQLIFVWFFLNKNVNWKAKQIYLIAFQIQ